MTSLQESARVYNSSLMTENRENNIELHRAPADTDLDTPALLSPAPNIDAGPSVRSTAEDKLQHLFPRLRDDQLKDVAETLHGYSTIAWRIYQRLLREQPEVIDELMRRRSIKGKVDSSQ